MANILIIDNDESFITALSGEIAHMGHQVEVARTLAEGGDLAAFGVFDVVFLNAEMPEGRGINALPGILETGSSPEVIILTDAGHPDEAELAIKMGAWDYVERPSTARAMSLSLVRAIQYRAKRVPREPSLILKSETLDDIVGSGPRMRRCLELLSLAAQSDANVLISGETGTGKELFAWAIHNNSRRANKRFVVVDCAALPETLVESTLFGYEKGAFTGADKSQSGLIKRADGGTLFLDEVGELPLSVQKSFLRVLQERRFRQVGGGAEVRSDFRLIAASNRDLDEMAHRQKFRKDLLFRLRAFTMELPPLRERLEDIRELAFHHISKLCDCYGYPKKGFSSDFFDVLGRYEWPGNVRELVNALERAVAAAGHEPVMFPKHLPIHIRVQLARASVGQGQEIEQPGPPRTARSGDNGNTDGHNGNANTGDDESESSRPLPKLVEMRDIAIAEVEQRYLRELMTLTKDMHEACRISGMSRSRLYALLKKYDIPSCFRI